ncbi:unnamed protein product [Closterium sp. Naga37s-1]|nr:unnamed protein product [Closterium sp. Naga37s-1]
MRPTWATTRCWPFLPLTPLISISPPSPFPSAIASPHYPLSYAGHHPLLAFFAVAENESIGRERYNFMQHDATMPSCCWCCSMMPPCHHVAGAVA